MIWFRKSNLILTLAAAVVIGGSQGCEAPPKPYGTEDRTEWPGRNRAIWAIAPAIDLSGAIAVDPLLQADLVYQQLQAVDGITVIPVNRVIEVFASLGIDRVQSEEQASLVCELLGCDGLVVPTVTAYDPYAPPKFGASLQLFKRQAAGSGDARSRSRDAQPKDEALPTRPAFVQSVGMFDSANGTVRQGVLDYAHGRQDPNGPLAEKEYFVSMDRYCGFVYHSLIVDLIKLAKNPRHEG